MQRIAALFVLAATAVVCRAETEFPVAYAEANRILQRLKDPNELARAGAFSKPCTISASIVRVEVETDEHGPVVVCRLKIGEHQLSKFATANERADLSRIDAKRRALAKKQLVVGDAMTADDVRYAREACDAETAAITSRLRSRKAWYESVYVRVELPIGEVAAKWAKATRLRGEIDCYGGIEAKDPREPVPTGDPALITQIDVPRRLRVVFAKAGKGLESSTDGTSEVDRDRAPTNDSEMHVESGSGELRPGAPPPAARPVRPQDSRPAK